MEFIKNLEPKNTEEIKPGLFIQRYAGGYRQIYPAVWNGKMNWYNFVTGGSWTKLLWFFIILFLVFAYSNDVGEYKGFYEEVNSDPVGFCEKVNSNLVNYEFGLEVRNESTYLIPDNP